MSGAAGSFAALVGTALFGAGVLVSTLAAFVILFQIRRRAPARRPRAVAVAGGALGAAGLLLFAAAASGWGGWGAWLDDQAISLAVGAGVLSLGACGVMAGRRRPKR